MALAGCLIVTASLAHAGSPLRRIVIDDSWAGYSPRTPIHAHWEITPADIGYRIGGVQTESRLVPPGMGADGRDRKLTRTVQPRIAPARYVDALVEALRAPLQPRIDRETLVPWEAGFQKVIDTDVAKLIAADPPSGLHADIESWRETLRQPEVLSDVFGRGLREAYHTDDYPFVEVTAEFVDGSSIVFCSSSQNYLLMPWKDKHGGQTFNRDIPRRLAALLPDVSVNKTRLFERLEEPDATSLLSAGLAPDLARFDAKTAAPEAWAELVSRFEVSRIRYFDYEGRIFDVTVNIKDQPKPSLRARLPLNGRALAHPDDVGDMARQLGIAAASPGLAVAMKASPTDDFEIDWRRGDSKVVGKTRQQFLDDMRRMGLLSDLRTHPRLVDGAVLVRQGRSPIHWMLMPDKRAVVWKEFMVDVPADGHPCPMVPVEGADDLDDLDMPSNCIGRVYAADGSVH